MITPEIYTKFIKYLLGILAMICIGASFHIILNLEYDEAVISPNMADSVIKVEIKKDTLNGKLFKHAVLTIDSIISKKTNKSEYCKPLTDEIIKVKYDLAYKLLFMGIGLLVLLALLPIVKDFNMLGVFSISFQDRLNALKQKNNDIEQTLASKPVEPPGIEGPGESISYNDDPQKGNWGGKELSNNKLLSAEVANYPDNALLYSIILKVTSIDPSQPLKGKVIFHLHPTFPNPNPQIFVVGGVATLAIVAYGSFTVGAEADDGATRLELDLATIPGTDNHFKTT